jgi:hypothetical protein
VPAGQPTDHEQPHPAGHRSVHDRWGGQALVGLGEFLLGHPDTTVGDLDHDPTIFGKVGGDHDVALRRRELGRVIQPLGQQMDQVTGRAAEH